MLLDYLLLYLLISHAMPLCETFRDMAVPAVVRLMFISPASPSAFLVTWGSRGRGAWTIGVWHGAEPCPLNRRLTGLRACS